MANSRLGGVIIFGIEDKTGRLVGLERVNEAIDTLLKATRLVKPAVSLVEPGPVEYNIDGVRLLAIKNPTQ
jgi:hypothetical protein